MKREPLWRRYLRFWGPMPERDVEDEFAFHIEAKIEELVSAGWSPENAHREATRLFGPTRGVRQECYTISRREEVKASRIEYWAGWARDVRYAVRSLLKTKASTAAAVAILTLAIGANTAVFTLFDRLIYRPLPLPKPSELVLLSDSYTDRDGKRHPDASFTYPGYAYLRDHNQVLSGLALQGGFRVSEQRGHEKFENPADALPVSGNYFEVLGIGAAAGRALNPADDDVAAPSHVAVASDLFARKRFNSAAEALGKTIYLNDAPFTIVGVLPAFFQGVYKSGGRSDLYVSMAAMGELYHMTLSTDLNRSYSSVGRLRRGLTMAAAQAQLQPVWQQFTAAATNAHPAAFDPDPATERIVVADGSAGIAGISGDRKTSLQLLSAILGLLLLMSCVNVGCLLMARTASRQQELVIRLSLGSGKARILRQLLMESALISVTGGAGGLLLAFAAEKLILAGLRWGTDPIDLSLDGRVLAFCLAISLVTGLLCGLAPAVQLLRGSRLVLNHERMARPVSSGRVLVVVEVALSLVMVAGAAMFVRGLHNLRSVPLGFSAEGVAVVRLVPEDPGHSDQAEEMERNTLTIAQQLRGTPGIESVTVADSIPFNDGSLSWSVRIAPGAPVKNPSIVRTAPGYFDTMQIPIIAGRAFTDNDDAHAPKATVLSAGLARGLFGDENPVGKSVRLGESLDVDVVGVAGDIKQGSVKRAAGIVLYLPISQPHVGGAFMGSAKLTVRTRMDARNVAKLVNDRIAAGRLPLVVDDASSLEEDIGASYFNDRVRMQATSAIGAIALLLIVAGIYGLMAYWVAQRTREIGVRVAIGSTSGGIVRLVLKQSTRLIVWGVILGVPGAIMAMRALSGMVFGLDPIDIASLVAASVILLATGIAAAAVPAWRAARLDPLEALRME